MFPPVPEVVSCFHAGLEETCIHYVLYLHTIKERASVTMGVVVPSTLTGHPMLLTCELPVAAMRLPMTDV